MHPDPGKFSAMIRIRRSAKNSSDLMCGAGCRHHQEEVGGHRHALPAQRVQEPGPRPEQAQPRLRHFYRRFNIRRRGGRSCWDLWRVRCRCFVIVGRRADDLFVIAVGCCVTVANFRWCEEFCDSWLAKEKEKKLNFVMLFDFFICWPQIRFQ